MRIQNRMYPETRVGGFSRVDGNIEFYQRVTSLLLPEMTVLDFGAGRGAFLDDDVPYRRNLANFHGRVGRVIGVDIDDAVVDNPSLDMAHVVHEGQPIPIADATVDLVVSSFVFEHVRDPAWVAAELGRVLRPGGWICARTPNKWGYIGVSARLVPNILHVAMLKKLQPTKPAADTFPTAYRLNTRRDLATYFPPEHYEHVIYTKDTEPAYFGHSVAAWRGAQLLFRLTPPALGATLYVFIRKNGPTSGAQDD